MMPIDRTLKCLEIIADHKGLRLEDVDGYTELCSFLSDLDVYGYSTGFSRADCLRVLKALIAHVCPSWVGCEMEFHRACQPEEVNS